RRDADAGRRDRRPILPWRDGAGRTGCAHAARQRRDAGRHHRLAGTAAPHDTHQSTRGALTPRHWDWRRLQQWHLSWPRWRRRHDLDGTAKYGSPGPQSAIDTRVQYVVDLHNQPPNVPPVYRKPHMNKRPAAPATVPPGRRNTEDGGIEKPLWTNLSA